jgi:hypothetical protein
MFVQKIAKDASKNPFRPGYFTHPKDAPKFGQNANTEAVGLTAGLSENQNYRVETMFQGNAFTGKTPGRRWPLME